MLTTVDQFSPQAYGLTGQAPPSSQYATAPSIAQSAISSVAPPWHPDNAMFWLGVIAAASMGLIGASVSGRAGPLRASASAGKS